MKICLETSVIANKPTEEIINDQLDIKIEQFTE